jgi:uncharacterized membrane protein YccC
MSWAATTASRSRAGALTVWGRFLKDHFLGFHLAANIFVATSFLWLILGHFAKLDPIWAISSMIASIDPNVNLAYQTFRGRLINSMLGCTIGLLFLACGGSSDWKLPVALSVTVLISSYIIHVPQMWRQAPITAALVVAASLTHHSRGTGAEIGLSRVGEVLLGCIIGLTVTFVMSKIWPPPEGEAKPAKA